MNIGKYGEDIAAKWLVDKGWRIIDRNVRQKFGEIDIVAMDFDKTLVLLEVKTLVVDLNGLVPEDNLSSVKLMKMRKMAESFSNANPQLINESRGWRIDALAISIDNCQSGEKIHIRHYENL